MASEGDSAHARTPARWRAIVNPVAGRGRAGARWPALHDALRRLGVDCDARFTARAGDGERLAREACASGIRALVAVGGDGTLNEIANGVLGVGVRCRLAAAPFGTGNDWALALGLPTDPGAFAAVVATGVTRAVDAGRIEYDDAGTRRVHHFQNVAGAGFDAWVVERLPSSGPRGVAYLTGLLRGLWRYRAPRFSFAGAGFAVEAPLFAAFAAIGPRCGGGMRFAPDADVADGLLDLVAVPHLGPWAAVRRLPHLYAGTLPRDARVRYGTSSWASIDAAPPARVEADGQLLGFTPARIEILPGAIDAIVSATETAR
jgi:diacylglycerol kinase (ATP)